MRKPPHETLAKPLDAKRGRAKAGAQAEDEAAVPPPRGHASERTCILTRETSARDDLIRLALGPDGRVAPDVRARAPGRGAWIGVDRPALEQAQAKGKLRGALARAFRTGDLSVPEDLGERIEAALRQAALDRLGLEARAGCLISGAEKVEVAARRGQVHLLLHAADAAEEGRRRLDQAWRVGSDAEGSDLKGLVFPLGRAILSLALGRENVVHVAIVDRAAAARVRRAIDRWRTFNGREAGLEAGPHGLRAENRSGANMAASAEAPAARKRDVNEGL